MAWTAEDRRRCAPVTQEMVRQGMPVRSAATIDAVHPPSRVGRPRVWPTLVVLRALWHVARDDRAWRRLPPGSPPRQTVWSRPMAWRRRAVLDRAPGVLVACRRLAAGRKRRPTAAIIDAQSVRTGPQRGPRGHDAAKKVKGGKRVLMIDTQGDPLGARVVPADTRDRDASHAPGPGLEAHASLLLAWPDRGLAGDGPAAFLHLHGTAGEVAGTPGRRGSRVEPRRWRVERTFGCLQRYRRLRVDDEASLETSRHMTVLASMFMTGMRLERMLQS